MSRGHLVLAPDKFKGSLSAIRVAQAIERGLRRGGERRELLIVPMADGGEGTVDAFLDSGAVPSTVEVRGPLGVPVRATFARLGSTAIVEMASASGLALLAPGTLDARRASTFGTGELVRAALDAGASRVLVGIGGSATNDGGAGMLVALGARLHDRLGAPLADGGAALADLESIDLSGLDARLRDVAFDVAADVDTPLCGRYGASAAFGPQKGASPADVTHLDRALARFADVAATTLGYDVRDEPGTGAAGGLGFALRAFLGGTIRPGAEIVADLRGLVGALSDAALCITGEGRIDGQTVRGKTVAGVAALARSAGVPVVAFAGTLEAGAEEELAALGVRCQPIVEGPTTIETAIADADALLERAAARFARIRALA